MVRGAWWAAVHGITQSQTWLKRLSRHACTGEGDGNPLQDSCLETPRDRGAWWAAVYWVAQGWTRLKQLSTSSSTLYCNYLFTLPFFSLRSPWRQGLLYLWIPSIQNKVLSGGWLFCGARAEWRRGERLGKTGSTLPFCCPLSASVSSMWSFPGLVILPGELAEPPVGHRDRPKQMRDAGLGSG